MRALAAIPLLLAAGCAEPDYTLSGCDPLDPTFCVLPWPSSYFEVEDETSPSGRRLSFTEDSFPENRDSQELDPRFINEKDGYATTGALLASFGDVDLSSVIPLNDIGAYTSETAKTVIIDSETGERVPHFVEVDLAAEPAERVLHLWPQVPLEFNRRYVVGIRGLTRPDGSAIEPSAAFQKLRDDDKMENPDLLFRKKRWKDEVWPLLEDQGFAREELLLAWDFHTVSREVSLGPIEHARDDMLAKVADGGPDYVVSSTEENSCEEEGQRIWKTLKVDLTVPLYTETDTAGTYLTRGADGLPEANGTTEVEMLVKIPCAAKADPEGALLVQYGHGFFGETSEMNTGWLAEFINDYNIVTFGVTWKGMSTYDVAAIAFAIASDVTKLSTLPERSVQGFVEFAAAAELMVGDFATDEAVMVDGKSVVNPETLSYYGISQGGILGGAYIGMSPRIDKAAFGVTGAPYQFLMRRSANFGPFESAFDNKYLPAEQPIMFAYISNIWEPSESGGWLYSVNRSVPDGMPSKRILIQNAIGDPQVSTFGGHIQARGYGAKLLAPATRPVWGLEEVEGPVEGSALVEWAYSDIPDEPLTATPPQAEPDPHECPRREPAAQDQVVEFLRTGIIEQYCDGPCESTVLAAECK